MVSRIRSLEELFALYLTPAETARVAEEFFDALTNECISILRSLPAASSCRSDYGDIAADLCVQILERPAILPKDLRKPFRAWLTTVLRRAVLDRLRKRKVRSEYRAETARTSRAGRNHANTALLRACLVNDHERTLWEVTISEIASTPRTKRLFKLTAVTAGVNRERGSDSPLSTYRVGKSLAEILGRWGVTPHEFKARTGVTLPGASP